MLEFSIREHTQLPIEVSYLYESGIEIPVPKNIDNRPRTPFSFQRFLIPQICNYRGRAIYLDADMQVFSDIAKLWQLPFAGCDLQAARGTGDDRRDQFSVMLLNCEQLNWDIREIVTELDSGNLDYHGLMYEMKVAKKIGKDVPPCWNSLESFDSETTSLLHYTDMNTQPWISLDNPLEHLWIECLRRAISNAFIDMDEIADEVKARHIRPSLLAQLDPRVYNAGSIPEHIKHLDQGFVAPYKQLSEGRLRYWKFVLRTLHGITRRCCQKLHPRRLFE